MHQPRRILYIDDDDGCCRLVEKGLGRRGHTVVTATNGEEGLRRALGEPFDVIALDHYMPGLDGLAILQRLRHAPVDVPVVYVTGSEESSVAVAALKSGAADYVVKSASGDFVDLLEQSFAHALAGVRLREEKEAAEEAVQLSNQRLQALLREVNHRVSNSLQMVSAMVNMQARMLDDGAARDALEDTDRRIQAIAQVHRRLYSGDDVESVAMDDYLAALASELEESWSTPDSPRRVRLIADNLRLHTDKAVSVGVIVNELVSNACKYAYDPGTDGEVRIHFSRDGDDHFRLVVEDDGPGFDPAAQPRGTGLGSRLLIAMARSLSATIDYDPGHSGVRATLRAAA